MPARRFECHEARADELLEPNLNPRRPPALAADAGAAAICMAFMARVATGARAFRTAAVTPNPASAG